MGHLTADCLLCQPGVTWARHGLWRNRQQAANSSATAHLADIDATALRGWLEDPNPVLVLAGCKRNANQHDTALLQRRFDDILGDLGGEDGERFRNLPQEKLLVSPEFSTEQRERYAQSGFVPMDIHDMARSLGIEPAPRMPDPNPEPAPEPEPCSSPSPF